MSKAEVIVKIALEQGHEYAPLWDFMNAEGVIKLLQDQVYLRADGYVNSVSRHAGSTYTMLAGVSPDAYRLFSQNNDAFVKEIFGCDLYKDFGVMDISVYDLA